MFFIIDIWTSSRAAIIGLPQTRHRTAGQDHAGVP